MGKIQPGTLSPDEERKVHFHIRRTRGELLFARCWLLVEGETEYWAISESARIMDIDLEEQGIRIVEYAHVGAATLVKVGNQLGIDWFCVCDGDAQGKATRTSITTLLHGRTERDHIRELPEPTIELLLCKAGYGSVYEGNVSLQKQAKITAKKGDPQYWNQILDCQKDKFKVPCVLRVVKEIETKGKAGVPREISEAIKAAVKLADN